MLTSFVQHGVHVKTTKITTPRSENNVADGLPTKPKMHTTVVAHFDDVAAQKTICNILVTMFIKKTKCNILLGPPIPKPRPIKLFVENGCAIKRITKCVRCTIMEASR